jgi:prevent-host-death family protein
MIHPSDIHTLTEFKRNSTALLERLESSGCSQVLTVDGKPKAVLISVEVYERLAERVEKAETLEGIRRGIADMEAGRTMSLAEAEAEVRKRLGLRRKKGSKSV